MIKHRIPEGFFFFALQGGKIAISGQPLRDGVDGYGLGRIYGKGDYGAGISKQDRFGEYPEQRCSGLLYCEREVGEKKMEQKNYREARACPQFIPAI